MKKALINALVAALGLVLLLLITNHLWVACAAGVLLYLLLCWKDYLIERRIRQADAQAHQEIDRIYRERAALRENALQELTHLRGQIADEAITARIDPVLRATQTICQTLREDQEKAARVDMSFFRYLSQLCILLADYANLHGSQTVTAQQHEKALTVLDTFGAAAERFAKNVYHTDAISFDVGADVLQTLLAQSGLVPEEYSTMSGGNAG